jgi:hypothetical protein
MFDRETGLTAVTNPKPSNPKPSILNPKFPSPVSRPLRPGDWSRRGALPRGARAHRDTHCPSHDEEPQLPIKRGDRLAEDRAAGVSSPPLNPPP